MKYKRAKIAEFDIEGKEITTLINQPQQAGEYNIKLDAANLQSGIYFYKLSAGEYTAFKKMILIK